MKKLGDRALLEESRELEMASGGARDGDGDSDANQEEVEDGGGSKGKGTSTKGGKWGTKKEHIIFLNSYFEGYGSEKA